jgi:hypothetical protein
MKTRVLFLFFSFFFSFSAIAQNWRGYDDDGWMQFTYTLQFVTSDYKVFPAADWQTQLTENGTVLSPPLSAMRSRVDYGFAIGLGMVKNISDRLDLRLVPTLTIADRVLQYGYTDVVGETADGLPNYYKDRKVKAHLVELPLSLKLKSERRGNFGAYLTGGVKYSADISSAKQNNDTDKVPFEKMLKNNKSYFSYEAGFGLDLYFKFLKLSPEIKYAATFNDILRQENSVFSRPIDKLMLRNVTFSLYIQ